MAAEGKPRRSKKGGNRGKKNKPKAPEPGPLSNTIFDSVLDYVNPTYAAGIGITVAALAASAVLLRTPKKKTGKKKNKNAPRQQQLKFAKSAPTLGGMTPGGPNGTGNGNDDEKTSVSVELVSKMFQSCLQSRQKDQKMIMDEFHRRIRTWNHSMLDTPAQTIVVNFLFWYFRMNNAPKVTFTSEQADYLRYWADYELNDKLDWSIFNLKFDFMYSIALLQRSIPHMKQFWKFIVSTLPREQPKTEHLNQSIGGQARKKDNYTLTRYQCASILGKWNEVKKLGDKIKQQTREIGYISQKDNYMLNYALRAMEMPQTNPNFGQMHKIVNILENEYPTSIMPPARFGVWQVHQFKYRNRDILATPTDDSKFVIASINMKDSDNWYHFYPPISRTVSMARIPREIKLWGRIAQMMSPMNGLSGCLPMTGTWSDLNLYLEMEWTYKPSNPTINRKKHGVLRLEREPIEEKVSSKNAYGQETILTGYKWTGTLTVTIKDEEDKFAARLGGLNARGGNLFGNLSNGGVNNSNDARAREQRIRDVLFNKKEENKNNNNTTPNGTDTTNTSENSNEKLPATSTTVTLAKEDGKSEEPSEAATDNNNKNDNSNEEIAVYDIELIIETDIEDSKRNEKNSLSTPTEGGNGISSGITRGGNALDRLRYDGSVRTRGTMNNSSSNDDGKDKESHENGVNGVEGNGQAAVANGGNNNGGNADALKDLIALMQKEQDAKKAQQVQQTQESTNQESQGTEETEENQGSNETPKDPQDE